VGHLCSNSNIGGTLLSGKTSASFAIPANLTAGTYYYFCELKSGKTTVRTNVATVTVTNISGADDISCKGSEPYTLSSVPSGTPVSWTITGPFFANPLTGNTTTVTRKGSGSGTLTAKNANTGQTIDSKSFPSCTGTTQTIMQPISLNNGCGNIIVENITVNSGVTLTYITCGDIIINNVTVVGPVGTVSGGKLILDGGEVIINSIDVELGAEFEIL